MDNGLCDPGWKQRAQLGYAAIQVRGDGDLEEVISSGGSEVGIALLWIYI